MSDGQAMAEQLQAAMERAAAAERRQEPSSMARQGTWVRVKHHGEEYTFDSLTVTRVDIKRHGRGGLYAVTIHQQGLHEWIRLSDLSDRVAHAIRDEILGLEESAWE